MPLRDSVVDDALPALVQLIKHHLVQRTFKEIFIS